MCDVYIQKRSGYIPLLLFISSHLTLCICSPFAIYMFSFPHSSSSGLPRPKGKRTYYHTAIHCNTLQLTATHCNSLQHTATHCNSLQLTATHCNTLQLFTKKSGSSSCWTSPTAGTILICIYTHIRTYISLFGIPASTDGCGNIKQMCGDVSADVGISNRGIHVCMCVYIHMCIVVRPRSTDIHTHRISNRDIYMCFVYSCIYTDMIHRHECVIAHV